MTEIITTLYPDGHFRSVITYKTTSDNKVKDGVAIIWHDDDDEYHDFKDVGNFKDDLKEGVWTTFHNGNDITATYTWKDGKLNGEFQIFQNPGEYSMTGSYKDNLYDGVIYDYEVGEIVGKSTYSDGKLNGISETYSDVGDDDDKRDMVTSRSNYRNDNLHGIQESYDTDGNKLPDKYYIDGREVNQDEFVEYIKTIGNKISLMLNLNELSLGNIIQSYSDL